MIWHNWAKKGTKYGSGCTVGTGGWLESRTPSKVWSRVLVCWSTAISETSFTKKSGWIPLPLNLTKKILPILMNLRIMYNVHLCSLLSRPIMCFPDAYQGCNTSCTDHVHGDTHVYDIVVPLDSFRRYLPGLTQGFQNNN